MKHIQIPSSGTMPYQVWAGQRRQLTTLDMAFALEFADRFWPADRKPSGYGTNYEIYE